MNRIDVHRILRYWVPSLGIILLCVGSSPRRVSADQNEKDASTEVILAVPHEHLMSRIRPLKSAQSGRTQGIGAQSTARGDRRILDFPGRQVTVDPIIPIYPNPTTSQTEMTVAVHPLHPDILIVGSNSASEDIVVGSQGWYYTHDAGSSWIGSDTLPLHTDLSRYMTDPAVSIDLDGNLFFNTIIFSSGAADLLILRSTDLGTQWTQTAVPNFTSAEDKNHLTIDVIPSSPFVHNIYTAYTDFALRTPAIMFSKSTDRGVSFSLPVPISLGLGESFSQGVNLSVGPSGELYAAWSGYREFPPDSTMLGFTRSMNGGQSFNPPQSIRWIQDLRGFLTKGSHQIRLNSYPVVSVDRSLGPRHGWIYIVYAENSPQGPDVFLVRSEDGGNSWSFPSRVNQDSTANDQWLPWLSVDPATGGIFVIYYDSRRFAANDSAEVYVSSSWDGGESFVDIRVSAEPFLPVPIAGLADGYIGDYLGIAAQDGIVWPVWNDDHTGIHQAYTARMEVVSVGASATLRVSPDTLDFGDVFTGYPETRIATLRNFGFPDTLQIDSILSGPSDFQFTFSPIELGGGVTTSMPVTFDPSSATSRAAILSIFSNDNSQPRYDFVVRGTGKAPPALEYAPDSLLHALHHGERDTIPLRISNGGVGPLTYLARVDMLFGSLIGHEIDSLGFLVLLDPSGDGLGVDVLSLHARVRNDSVSLRIEFKNPPDTGNFGGYISIDVDRDSSTGVPPSFGTEGQNIGAEFELAFFDLAAGIAIIIDAESQVETDRIPVIVDGTIIELSVPFNAIGTYDGVIDVTSVFGTLSAPTDWMPGIGHGTIPGAVWVTIEPAAGGVAPLDSLDLSVILDAAELTGGSYRAEINLESNDPARSDVAIPVILNVTGTPRIEFAPDTISLPQAYAGFTLQTTLSISNPGSDVLAISSMVAEDLWIDLSFQSFVLEARHDTTLLIEVTAPEPGTLHTQLHISSNDPDRPFATIPIEVSAALAPELMTAPDSLSFRIRLGDSAAQMLTIYNLGPGELEWNISANDTGAAIRQARWGISGADGTTGSLANAHVLTAVPAAGSLVAGDSDLVTVEVFAGGLEDGHFALALDLESNDPRTFLKTIPVGLEVVGLRPGDANGDFRIDSRDLIHLVRFIFREGPEPAPGTGDPNCDSAVTILDLFLLVEHIFLGGVEPECF